jgi:hypothetical protein
MSPVLLNVSPGGSAPVAITHVRGGTPPVKNNWYV